VEAFFFIAMTKKELEEKVKSLQEEIERLSPISEELLPQTGIVTPEISIVYPNESRFSQWQELKYSLRSIQKNLRGIKFKIFIVGDLPEWASDQVVHIPCEYSRKTPRIDILHKHAAVRDCEEVNDEYIWMNDDIYFINPVQYADLCLNVARNSLETALRQMPSQTIWGKDNAATFELLQKEKLSTWNYAMHIPHRYEKEKVKLLVEKYNMYNRAIVLEQIYYNYWFGDFRPYMASLDIGNNICFSINRPFPRIASLNAQMKVKKFMNNGEGGMGSFLKDTLKKLFPEPSVFEK
jgi:hypothetical protein